MIKSKRSFVVTIIIKWTFLSGQLFDILLYQYHNSIILQWYIAFHWSGKDMSTKSCSILYSDFFFKNGKDFSDIQYLYITKLWFINYLLCLGPRALRCLRGGAPQRQDEEEGLQRDDGQGNPFFLSITNWMTYILFAKCAL